MQIEQALYGECSGGHSLLVSSGDKTVSTGIVQRLDLPDTALPGVEWSPFLRGFPYEDHYVLSRTFHDTSASRGGMVFSHALLAPLDEIGETRDLGPLLDLLATSDRQRPDATTVQFAHTEERVPQAIDLIDTAEALGAEGQLPIVRLGHAGFDELVVSLWAHLLPEIRRGFAFRLSFGPRDLIETPMPALVCTPRGMVARWSEYPVIRPAMCSETSSLAAAMLSGHGKAAPLVDFMQETGAKPATFPDLRLFEQAYRFDIGELTLERRTAVIRLIERLSPDSDAGEGGKNRLVRQLCDVMPTARADEILRLRNLQLSAFSSAKLVWKALKRWMTEYSYPQDQDIEILSVFEDAFADTNAVQEWQTAVLDGLAIASSSPNPAFSNAFWRWAQIRPETTVAVFRHVPVEARIEESLVATVPRNLGEAAEALATHALSRGWLRLHGTVMSASCSALDAVRRQIKVDTDPVFAEGLRLALRHAKPMELVQFALVIEDSRMPCLAGEAVAKDRKLLANVDFTAIKAQAIWSKALAVDAESWQGPADPEAAFHLILDRRLDGNETDTSLIERLSDSPVANLGSYPRRREIWSYIAGAALHNLLSATAKGWLRQAASGENPFVPEHELQTAILEDDELEQSLDTLIPDRIGTAVRIVTALDRYDQRQFLCLLRKSTSRTTSLAISDAEGVGRLLIERRWEDAAAYLVDQYKTGRGDLKPALRACCDMLDFWERILVSVREPPVFGDIGRRLSTDPGAMAR